ncbi:MAG: activator of HSP90 ATPase 1 family protein [Aureispira sp.]|nr:activator of HSP90 ATPase 1 family protein [Aureispira sp.]
MKRISFQLEYLFRASPTIIHNFLTTPDCLTRWFCEDCNLVDDRYTFEWDGSEEEALLIDDIEAERVRLQWEEYGDEYLEFKLGKSPVTGETILELTAFSDEDELEEETQFWDTQMENLKRATGG